MRDVQTNAPTLLFFSIRRYTSSAGFILDTCAHVTTSAQKEAARTMGNVTAVE